MDRVTGSSISVDTDEGIGDIGSEVSSTSSVRSSVLKDVTEHGRRYHGYKDGNYHRPNDENELDRLDLMSAMFSLIHNGKLHRAPLQSTSPRILDLGTGTGIWSIDMGDKYPAAEIVGVDISASVPAYVPPNVQFEIDDVEDEWTYRKPFDYIHSRYMAGSIRDWPALISQCYENLSPGGWVEFEDFDIDYYSEDGSLTTDHALRRWLTISYDAEPKTQRSLRPGKNLAQWIKDAGFANIQVIKTPLPLGRWPRDSKLKQIGLYNWTQLWEGLEGMSLRLFIDILSWRREELEVLLAQVRKDLLNPKIHAIFDLYTVWAQKPG